MSYFYPTGLASGYSGLSALWAIRMSGVTGSPTPVPVPTGTDGFLQAMADGVLASVGFQAQSDAAGTGSASTNSTSYGDVGGYSTWTVTIPATKTYLLHVDLAFFCTVAADNVYFRVAVDGTEQSELQSARHYVNTANENQSLSFRQAIAFAEGSRVIKLRWKTGGTATANVDTNSFRCFTLTG